jgi:tetratricopeptide (TPR) repeat protein
MKKLFIIFLLVVTGISSASAQYSALLKSGDSCIDCHDTFHALQFFSEAKKFGNSNMLHTRLANCYFKRADYRRCRGELLQVTTDSLTQEAMRQLFYSYGNLSDIASEARIGEALIKKYPMDGEVTADLAALYNSTDMENYDRAYIITTFYALKDTTNIAVMRQQGDAAFFNKDFVIAKDVYSSLLALGDSTYNTYYTLGLCSQQLKDTLSAYNYLKKAAFLSGYKKPGCMARLGSLCIDLAPKNETCMYEGVEFLENALTLFAQDPATMYITNRSLGDGYYMEKKFDKAIKAWREALKWKVNSVTVYYNIAQAYTMLDDIAHEMGFYKAFLSWAYTEENKSATLQGMIKHAESIVGANAVKRGEIINAPE